MKTRWYVFLTLILVLLAVALVSPLPVAAQDVEVTQDTANSFSDFLAYILTFLQNVTYLPLAVTGVILITNLVKLGLDKAGIGINPVLIALAVQVVVWVAFMAAGQLGYGDKFKQGWDAAIAILQQLLPLFGISLVTSHAVYNKARDKDVPLFGYSPNDYE